MDKKNWIILGAVVIVAAVMLLISPMMMTKSDENVVIITVEGMEYARVPLTQPPASQRGWVRRKSWCLPGGR